MGGSWNTRREPTNEQSKRTNSVQKKPRPRNTGSCYARQQCYQLCHCAAWVHLLPMKSQSISHILWTDLFVTLLTTCNLIWMLTASFEIYLLWLFLSALCKKSHTHTKNLNKHPNLVFINLWNNGKSGTTGWGETALERSGQAVSNPLSAQSGWSFYCG